MLARLVIWLCAAFAAVFASAGAAEAAPPWSEPRVVATPPGQLAAPSIDFRRLDGALVSWTDNAGSRSAGTGYASLAASGAVMERGHSAGALVTRLVLDGGGRAVLLRRRRVGPRVPTGLTVPYRLEAWFGAPPAGPPRLVAVLRDDVDEPGGVDLDANAGGQVAAAWVEQYTKGSAGAGTRVRVALGSSKRGFGRPRTLATGGSPTRDSGAVAVAYATNGDLVVAYSNTRREGRRDRPVVAVRVRPRGGRFGRAQVLGRRQPLTQLVAASGRDGRTAVAWGSQDSGEEADRPWVVRAAIRPARRARFARAQLLDPGEARARVPGRVALDMTEDGRATLAWSNVRGGPLSLAYPVRTASTGSGGGFGPVSQVAETGGVADVAVARSGAAVITWSTYTPETNESRDSQLLAALRPPGAMSFGVPELISTPATGASDGDVAYDPRTGRPAVVWASISATPKILLATRGP